MAESKTTKAVFVEKDGLKTKDIDITQVPDNELLVKIEAAPINPSDVAHTRKSYVKRFEPPYRTGFEGAGTVVQLGKNYNGKFKVGDKVCILTQEQDRGTWSQYGFFTDEHLFHMNTKLSFEQAASHFINPMTVILMLREVQKEGHKTVIHSVGASALGKMMIRLFKENGIKTINLVRRDDVKDELTKLGADYVLNMKDTDFEQKLEEVAKKEHATKFYDAIGGDLHLQVLRKMPPGSISNIYGLLSGKIDLGITAMDLFSGKTVSSFYVFASWSKLSQKEKEDAVQYTQERLDGILDSYILKAFPLDSVKEAIEHSEKNASKGKTIIKP